MPAATPTMESQVADLIKQGASQQEAIETVVKSVTDLKKHLDEPQYPDANPAGPQRPHVSKGAMGYWDADAPQVIKTRVRRDGKYQPLPLSMPKAYKPREVFKSPGEFYRDLVRNPEEFKVKHAKTLESVHKAIQGMNTQTAADGGAWIVPEFSNEIIDIAYANTLWAATDGYTVAGNNLTFKANAETSRANGSRHGGLRGYWIPEGGTITKSHPRTRNVALRLNKAAVLVYITQEQLDDAGPAFEQYVVRKAGDEFNFLLGDAVINGTGVGMPLGITNSPAFLSITKETGQEAATILSENIDKVWARRQASGDYQWYNNQDIHTQLAGLSRGVGAAGDLVYNPPGGISAAPYGTLKGRPLNDIEFAATLGTVGDLLLADLGQYITISKGGIVQAASMHVEFLTDQMALRFTLRVDGRPAHVSPITPYKGSNTQSFFVGIATRS